MAHAVDAFAVWLRATPISEAVRVMPWLWPLCEIVHFFGLSLLVGVAGFFDLRLLGFMARVPLGAAFSLLRWAKIGFALSALTGVIFFVGAPDQYVNNIAFYAKLLFLVVAGLNAVLFEAFFGTRVSESAAVSPTPASFKAIAAVSLLSWFAVIYWGRMLPFVGNAF